MTIGHYYIASSTSCPTDRKPGHEGNVAPPTGENCPCTTILDGTCHHVIEREKEIGKQITRAEKAEKELAEVKANADVAIGAVVKQRDALKAENERLVKDLSKRNTALFANCAANGCETLKATEKERDALKAARHMVEPWKESIQTCHLKSDPLPFDDPRWSSPKSSPVQATWTTWIREDIVNKKVAAAEQRAKDAEAGVGKWQHEWEVTDRALRDVKKERDVYQNRVIELEAHGPRTMEGNFCTTCGTPYDSSEQAPKPHVPRWAHPEGYLTGKCKTCKKASRFKAWLQWVLPTKWVGMYPCRKRCMAETYDEYEPRISRAERKRASLAGQLKAEKQARKADADRNHRNNETSLAQFNKTCNELNGRIAELESKLAASVPLANAIGYQPDIKYSVSSFDDEYPIVHDVSFQIRQKVKLKSDNLVLFRKADLPRTKEEKPQ